jgi:hypothetical protein
MPFREIFKRKNIRPAWQFRAKGVVWRIIPAPSGLFVGEDRNIETKRATFFCLDHATGDILWQDVAAGEQWWLGVEAVHGDRVLLHGFAQPDMPEHRGIIALDLFTGKHQWRRDDLKFFFASEDSVYGAFSTLDQSVVVELNAHDGSERQRYTGESQPLHSERSHDTAFDDCLFPSEPETDPEELTPSTEAILRHCESTTRVGPIEVVETNGLTCICYHEKTDTPGVLRIRLDVVANESDEVVFTDVLESAVRGLVPDAFFIRGGLIFFVKERTTLTAIRCADLKG